MSREALRTKETCSSLKRKVDHKSIEQESRSSSSQETINSHVAKKQKSNLKELVDPRVTFSKRKELEGSSESVQPIAKKLKVTKPHPVATTAPRIPGRIIIPTNSSTINTGPRVLLKEINVSSQSPPNTTVLTSPSASVTVKGEINSLSCTSPETSSSSFSSPASTTRHHRDRPKETEELDFDTLLKRREEASTKAQNKNKVSSSKPTRAASSKSPASAKQDSQVKLKQSSSAGPSTANILEELLQS